LLQARQISAVGISEASAGFLFRRNKPAMSVLMACNSGRGNALIDGKLKVFLPGMAYLMPPEVRHGYEATGRRSWRVCWVCFVQPVDQAPIISFDRPKLVHADALPLEEAIYGLFRESLGQASFSVQKLHLELIQEHAMRIVRDSRPHDRLGQLWSSVESDLARGWTLEELARKGGMSVELLRVLSHQSTGRSPMRQVACLRMQSAAIALASSRIKISAIAGEVGYSDPFAFSVAFKRHFGTAPGAYRLQKLSASIH